MAAVDTVLGSIEKRGRIPGRFGTVPDVDGLVAELRTSLVQPREPLTSLAGDAREHEAAMLAGDEAVEICTRADESVATTLGGLYRLAGEDELASRIRPTARRASGMVAGGPGDESDGPDDQVGLPTDDSGGFDPT